jgi:RNA polymerase sigma factor (sigma-70 family)
MTPSPETHTSHLERLKNGDREVLLDLYRDNERMVRKYVLENSGTIDDAEDLLQDALVVLWQNTRDPNFTLQAKISTYLFAIVRNQWLKQLEKRKRSNADINATPDIMAPIPAHERLDLKIVQDYLNDMGDLCRKILMMYYFDGFDMQTIADANHLANTNTAKSKKYQCLKELGQKIKSQYSIKDFLQ